jgi:hypothetical protein
MGLTAIGLGDCFYQPHLHSAILAQIGFTELPDDLFDFYNDLIDRHNKKLEKDFGEITKRSMEIYHVLLQEKTKRYGE